MADDMVRKLAGEQRRRLVAGLMGAAEAQPWYSRLTAAERDTYRKEVMFRIGVYHDFMLDVLKVADDGSAVINDHALELLRHVHDTARRIETRIEGRTEEAVGGVPTG